MNGVTAWGVNWPKNTVFVLALFIKSGKVKRFRLLWYNHGLP